MAPIFVGAVVDNPPPKKRPERARVPAGWQTYDAAVTTDQNRKHWSGADSFSALWANNPNTRRTLRNRSRYEWSNNGYLKGALKTSTNDVVGRRGPRHRFAFDDADVNAFLDLEFAAWMKAVGFRRKLKTFIHAKKGDGEAVALVTTNPKLKAPVKLDLKLVEAEQLATPLFAYTGKGEIRDRYGMIVYWATDGILFDDYGNPTEYHVLKQHPGDGLSFDPLSFDRFPAESVIHYFDATRPGQARGVPDTMTSLPLSAMIRRYTLACVQTAENQANITAVLETDGAGDPDDPPAEIPSIEFERGIIPTLPDKYKLHAVEASQPTTTYPQFKREILCEIGRGLQMPYNVIAADSSMHNYSSARLDTQEYQDDVYDERTDIEEVVLDRVKEAWLAEAAAIPGYFPFPLSSLTVNGRPFVIGAEDAPGAWFWPGWGFIDPVKEVTAIQVRLENNLTTLKAEHAKNGDDWREVLDQRAVEIAYCQDKGLPIAAALPAPSDPNHPANRPEPAPAPPSRREEVAAWSR